jgi:hypothetical protein
MLADSRMHAVRSDQKIAFGAGAIGEVGHNGLIGPVFDSDQALFERYFDIFAPGRRQDRLEEHGAAHVHRGLTEALLHIPVDRAEPGPRLREEIEGFGDRAAADHLVGEADLGQHMHAVWRNLQTAADAGRLRPRLEHLCIDTSSFEEDGADRTGNAGADDDGSAGSLCHVLAPCIRAVVGMYIC